MKVKDFSLFELLGKGTMGEVYLSKKDGSNRFYATKKIDKKKADRPQVRKYFINEITLLRELKHPKIISLADIIQTGSHYYIVMDYCNGGSLLKCLKKYKKLYKKPFSEKIVQYLMKQIVSGLKYIHRRGIIHRDIKLDNILVKFYNNEDKKSLNMLKTHIKICDFGISIKPGDGQHAYTAIGSPANMDPYILKKLTNRNDLANSEGYDKSADIWSLGSSCYEMLIGKRVFNGRNIKELNKKVEEGNYILPMNLSKEVVSFINGMLQYDPKKRLTCEELARHHFLTRDVKDFHPIDFSLIYSKLNEKGIVINAKDNNTIWKAFNEYNDETIKKSLKNNENMWTDYNNEIKIKLSLVPTNILDQNPFDDNYNFDITNNNNDANNKFEQNNNNNINNFNNNIFIPENNAMNFNDTNNKNKNNIIINNNDIINNMNNMNNFKSINETKNIHGTQINYNKNKNIIFENFNYDNNNNNNNTNNYNNNFNSTNTQIPINKLKNDFNNLNLGNTHTNSIGYNFNEQNQINFISINNQDNKNQIYGENDINNQINKTQINTSNYKGDIRIKKQIARTDESCTHQ